MNIILRNIKSAIDGVQWQSETKKKKAIELCESIYHLYVIDGGDFNNYRALSMKFFKKVIKTSDYIYEVKNGLIDSGIIEMDNSYDVKKHIGKGYRFNQELISGKYVTLCSPKSKEVNTNDVLCSPNEVQIFAKFLGTNLSNKNFANLISDYQHKHVNQEFDKDSPYYNCYPKSTESLNQSKKDSPYYNCYPKLKSYILGGLSNINFDESVQDWIDNYQITRNDIKVDDEITTPYFDIIINDDKLRYSLEKAKSIAKKFDRSVIQLKDKFYIEDIDSFLKRKTTDARLIFEYSITKIKNKKFICERNETNRRLDYNLTNMKSDLLNFIRIDGERLIELDIANAQFAILSFITDHLDNEFINQSQDGTLYGTIDKQKMFRVAFDKIKSDQDDVRSIFPKTMEMIDGFKAKFGYKSFSNLLQNVESMIMIDGVMNKLIDSNIQVFPIHDAIRVKESDVDMVKEIIEDYFNEINFKCKLRIKGGKKAVQPVENEKIEIVYKGFVKVMIDKPTKEDKELFLNKMKELGPDAPEWMVMETKLFEKNKLWYFYTKWRNITPFSEISGD